MARWDKVAPRHSHGNHCGRHRRATGGRAQLRAQRGGVRLVATSAAGRRSCPCARRRRCSGTSSRSAREQQHLILEAVPRGCPSPPGSRASRSAFGRRTTSASWTRARGSRRGARRRGRCLRWPRQPKRHPMRRVGASLFWPIEARRQSSSPSPEIAGAAERLGASVYPSADSTRALSPCPGL